MNYVTICEQYEIPTLRLILTRTIVFYIQDIITLPTITIQLPSHTCDVTCFVGIWRCRGGVSTGFRGHSYVGDTRHTNRYTGPPYSPDVMVSKAGSSAIQLLLTSRGNSGGFEIQMLFGRRLILPFVSQSQLGVHRSLTVGSLGVLRR